MALDKILDKLQLQIKEILPTMELFVDDTIQPSVIDSDNLKQQLILLQENLVIYKYLKLKKEISPSFNIHAKVSEQQIEVLQPLINDVKDTSVEKTAPKIENLIENTISEITQQDNKNTDLKKLNIGLNDKFRFINELFKQNTSEYNIAFEQLNALKTWDESELYLNSLKEVYLWKENSDNVKYFYSIAKKRFE